MSALIATITADSKHRFEKPARVCGESDPAHDEMRETPAEMLSSRADLILSLLAHSDAVWALKLSLNFAGPGQVPT